jgi:hypothetical protein
MTALVDLARDLRLGAVLAHSLPGLRLELVRSDGDDVIVGFGVGCCLTPCELRAALVHPEVDENPLGGTVATRLHDAPPVVWHAGLGVYQYRSGETFGYAHATLLDSFQVRDALREALADEPTDDPLWDDPFHALTDELLGVTLLFSRHEGDPDGDLAEQAEARAFKAAIACLAAELVDTVASCW